MRAKADKAGDPASENPSETLSEVDVSQESQEALIASFGWGGTHNARFDNINRTADRGCNKSRRDGCREMCGETVIHAKFFKTEPLKDIV